MWTEKNINLIDKVPTFFADIYEYQSLFLVLDDEIIDLKTKILEYKDNLFLLTANEEIITRYQNILKTIISNYITYRFVINYCKNIVII